MKRTVLIIAMAMALTAIPGQREQAADRSPIRAYLMHGNGTKGIPGFTNKHNAVVGGGELLLNNGFGVGMDFGGRGKLSCEKCEAQTNVALFGSYNLPLTGSLSRLEPFINGGYSFVSPKGWNISDHMVTFGGGANYWLGHGFGVRVEARDNLSFKNGTAHYPEYRVGVIAEF